MSLKNVVNALKRLSWNERDVAPSSEEEHLEYFCAEDTLLTNDLSVSVTGFGKLSFPLTSDTVQNIIKVSSKAKFGKGEATLLDITVRDTQMIPASMLKVGINDEALCGILERISSGLNIDKNSCLVPHLYNMLIYGPGQFFKMHRDSVKIKNMIATLVILLPSSHKGGDLIICHKNNKHIFFNSPKCNVVKCIAFYSDCQHEIEKVIEGYRVALTYNVGLQSPGVTSNALLDEDLNRAVQLYFSSKNKPKRLVFFLNHNYSEHSLKWNLLKGTDRTHVFSLLAVAKEQGRVPCLALADYKEECDQFDEEVLESETELVFWVDEFNLKFEESTEITEDELCYTTETTDLFEPYKVEEEEPTGNEGGLKESWYRRACVVLWSNKWDFQHGFKNNLYDLKQLTTKKGSENLVLGEINKAGNKFFNTAFWNDQTTINLLMDIAVYVKDKETAGAILTRLSYEVINPDRIDYLLLLEQNYDKQFLYNIIMSWYKSQKDGLFVKKSLVIIEKYLEQNNQKQHSFVQILLAKTVKEFLRKNEKYCDLNIFVGTQLSTMYKIFQISTTLEHSFSTKKVINHILLHPSVYPLHLANVLLQIQSMIPQKEIHKHRNFARSVLELFDNKLIPLLMKDETNGSWPFNFPCKCPDCNKLLSFLHSSVNTIDVLLSLENRQHVIGVLKYLKEQPVKCTIESEKVFIEKKPELVGIRKKLLGDLDVIKKQLINMWISTKQDTVHSECIIGDNEEGSFSGSLVSQLGSSEPGNKRKKIQ